jgi:hypothetical protein
MLSLDITTTVRTNGVLIARYASWFLVAGLSSVANLDAWN